MNSATIMLIPDASYTSQRPKIKDHHLTVAYFGPCTDLDERAKSRLTSTVHSLAQAAGGPIPAVANGIGLFDAGKDGFAVVDLIDGIGTFRVRMGIENLFGPRYGYELDNVRVDYRHGFTPHITREYLDREDEFYGEIQPGDIDQIKFNFVAIGFWCGDNRYEISL